MRRAFMSLTTGIVIALVTPRADADTGAQEWAPVPGESFMRGDVEGDPNEAPKPATVAAIKAQPAFAAFPPVRMSRLSVMPVSDEHWKRIIEMGDGLA